MLVFREGKEQREADVNSPALSRISTKRYKALVSKEREERNDLLNQRSPHQGMICQSAPFSYRNILVLLDGSTAAEHFLDDVQLLADASGATLTLIAVMQNANDPTPGRSGKGQSWASTLPQNASEKYTSYLEDQAEALRSRGLIVLTERYPGTSAEEILQISRRHHADLIMMAIHSGDVQRCLLGTVAASVLRRAEVPVLLVREQQEEWPRISMNRGNGMARHSREVS